MQRADGYQYAIIALASVTAVLFGVFIYREIFPEYKIYQNRYQQLEEMRSQETGVKPAPFKFGVKQIVQVAADRGPETIDRCVSCHVAMKLPHFSPTKVKVDVNGKEVIDADGNPVLVSNEDYVWGKIFREVAELTDTQELARLEENGKVSEVRKRRRRAKELKDLTRVHSQGHEYDMTKVLSMHPLIGRETRPFQYHSLEDFGCVSCHQGNGRGLVTDRAHGPVWDGTYHYEHHPVEKFLEPDPKNDPEFAKIFNHKPSHRLLFHTTPILPGRLLEAKCVQCHQSIDKELAGVINKVDILTERKEELLETVQQGFNDEVASLLALVDTKRLIQSKGYSDTLEVFRERIADYRLTPDEMEKFSSRIAFLQSFRKGNASALDAKVSGAKALEAIDREIENSLGDDKLRADLETLLAKKVDKPESLIKEYLQEQRFGRRAKGSIFAKMSEMDKVQRALSDVDHAKKPILQIARKDQTISSLATSIDTMTSNYQRGRQLFLSQACHACHRISGLSRGGVGPELTDIGLYYPWYIKESMVWPQSNLKSSTMPNFRMDHEELADLMTFLLAQRREQKYVAEVEEKQQIKAWELGKKQPWEEPVPPTKIKDVREGMLVFATQGCASCHKLKGYDSNIGFQVEKSKPPFEILFQERQWFRKLFAENITGKDIVKAIETHKDELDARIQSDVRENGLLQEVNQIVPGNVETYYSSFKFASRVKNYETENKLRIANDLNRRKQIRAHQKAWQERVERVLHMYVQEYGLGRSIGPALHWSGVYRDERWLVQHFRNPAAHSAKSIMPVLPFDDSKFYMLTHMLQVVGRKNRDQLHEIWQKRGFDPKLAFEMLCSSCHGENQYGNGPVAEWIYPIPKNLRDGTFLRNLTKERATQSIVHGVKGGPMPPWGEAPAGTLSGADSGNPVLSPSQVQQLVDWLYKNLPGARVIRGEEDVMKWQYEPEDFIRELENEGGWEDIQSRVDLPSGEEFIASIEPMPIGKKSLGIDEVFDKVTNPLGATESHSYYIKKKFYTAENIDAGRRHFIANCAHCHGKEGAGNGDRAVTMQGAKPRMLSNIAWLETRDDLRILRSIKYGVAGTSMTPWGDKTSALQRLQMVTYIRQLTYEKRQRDSLQNALYDVFENALLAVEKARINEYKNLESMEISYKEVQYLRTELYQAVQTGQATPAQAGDTYDKELDLLRKLEEQRLVDSKLKKLAAAIIEEKKLYEKMGLSLINKAISEPLIELFLNMLRSNLGKILIVNGRLVIDFKGSRDQELQKQLAVIVAALDEELVELESDRAHEQAGLRTKAREERLDFLGLRIKDLSKVKRSLMSGVEGTKDIQDEQRKIYASLKQREGEGAAFSMTDFLFSEERN